jgi:preprotein translocase subunit SecB
MPDTKQQEEPQFIIQRIYAKDISFESPHAPEIFAQEWQPETNLQLNTNVNPLDDEHYEVELIITVTVKSGENTAFLVEVNQAGVFFITGYETDYQNQLLASYCPTSLFPYAREAIANLVSKGGFPELHLSPINFDALYAQRLEEQNASTNPENSTEHA